MYTILLLSIGGGCDIMIGLGASGAPRLQGSRAARIYNKRIKRVRLGRRRRRVCIQYIPIKDIIAGAQNYI